MMAIANIEFNICIAKVQGFLHDSAPAAGQHSDCESGAGLSGFIGSCLRSGSYEADDINSLHNLLLWRCSLLTADEWTRLLDAGVCSDQLDSYTAMLPAITTVDYLQCLQCDALSQCSVRLLQAASSPARALVCNRMASVLCSRLLQLAGADGAAALGRQLWPSLPAVLRVCMSVLTDETASDSDRDALLRTLESVLAQETESAPCGQEVLALTACISDQCVREDVLCQRARRVSALLVERATTLFKLITLDGWLEWADITPQHSECTLQAAVIQHLTTVSDAVTLSAADRPLPDGLSALVRVCSGYIPSDATLSLSDRCDSVLASGPRHRLHLHWLATHLDVCLQHQRAVEALVNSASILRRCDVDAIAQSLVPLDNSPDKDKLIQVCVDRYLVPGNSDWVQSILVRSADLRRSDWHMQLSELMARLIGGSDSRLQQELVVRCCSLVLQCPAAWVHAAVQYCTQSDGKSSITASLLTAVNAICPIRLITASDSRTLLETEILSGMDGCGVDEKKFKRLSRLLMTSLRCGAVTSDHLSSAVVKLSCSVSHTLSLVQELLRLDGGLDSGIAELTDFCLITLDKTLDLDRDAVGAICERELALACVTLISNQYKRELCVDRVAALVSRCHPLTELYGCRLLLDRAVPEDATLLGCLVDADSAGWPVDQTVLLRATLASYLPYLCVDEWHAIHGILMVRGAGEDDTATRADPDVAPAACRLTAAVWYYADLLTLWVTTPPSTVPVSTTPPSIAPPSADQTLCQPPDRLQLCIQNICQLITRSMSAVGGADAGGAGAEEDVDRVTSLLLPLSHMLQLLKDQEEIRKPLERLVLLLCTEFVKQMTERLKLGGDAGSPVEDYMERMDGPSQTLSQFIVALFNIPSECAVKRQVVQHLSGSVLASIMHRHCTV